MAKRSTKKSSNKQSEPRKQIIAATMNLASKTDWQEITLSDIAIASKLPLSEIRKIFRSKNSVLKAFNQQIDAEVIANASSVTSDEAVRDRLFGLLMLRFDALSRYKKAVARILRGIVATDPVAGIIGFCSALISMKQILEMADISTSGFCGQLKVRGLVVVYLKTLCVWLKDDTPELAETMANLDKSLARVERIILSFSLGRFEGNTPKTSQ